MRNILILIICIVLFTACAKKGSGKQVDEGKVTGEVYESHEIGWKIEIPKGWEVMSKDRLEAQTKKGMGHIENATGAEVDYSELKHLISFHKDNFNSFQSTSEPFNVEDNGSWQENSRLVKEVLFETYFYKGIKADTASAVETIDGLTFDVFKIKIYGNNGEPILYQDMYSRLINGYSFGVIMNYNNDQDKDEMKAAWSSSKFNR